MSPVPLLVGGTLRSERAVVGGPCAPGPVSTETPSFNSPPPADDDVSNVSSQSNNMQTKGKTGLMREGRPNSETRNTGPEGPTEAGEALGESCL